MKKILHYCLPALILAAAVINLYAGENPKPAQAISNIDQYSLIDFNISPLKIAVAPKDNREGLIRLKKQEVITNFVQLPQILEKNKKHPVKTPGITGTAAEGEHIKSMAGESLLMSNEYAAFKINLDNKDIEYIKPAVKLDGRCTQAMDLAPKWMRNDLFLKFRELKKKGKDGELAQVILDAQNKWAYLTDEVAFVIAHMSVESLMDARFYTDYSMIIENAQMIYAVADSLNYVRLVEKGSYKDKSYYTTTEYLIKDSQTGQKTWVEIPKEYYYWYIVHPKIYQEGVYERDLTNSVQQRTYDHFWRDYIWNNPNKDYDYTKFHIKTTKGSIDSIPRFGELMQMPQYLWERQKGYYPFGRDFTVNDGALNVIGNWASRAIPVDAKDNRPIQPNQALYEHNGNCGEDAYLVAAACRTALIPIIHLNTSCEDHAYGAIWDQDWQHFEFFRGGLADNGNEFYGITNMMDRGSYGWVTSIVEGTRGDGYQENHSEYYITDTSEIQVKVLDDAGNPVDGAKVILYAAPYAHGTGAVTAGFAWTNSEGMIDMKVGAGKTYYAKIKHPDFGEFPPESNKIYVLSGSVAQPGQKYYAEYTVLNGYMPEIDASNHITPDTSAFGVKLNMDIKEIITGVFDEDSQNSRFYKWEDTTNAAIGFFICDQENYDKYVNGESFDGYQVKDLAFESDSLFFGIPADSGTWYVVMTNATSTCNYKYVNADCELVGNFNDVPHIPAPQAIYPEDNAVDVPLDVTLKWQSVPGATNYTVEFSTVKSFATTLAKKEKTDKTEFKVPALNKDTGYYWRVKSNNEFGESEWSDIYSFITIPPKQLDAPLLQSPANGAKKIGSEVTLKWGTVPEAVEYNVQLSDHIALINKIVNENLAGNELDVNDLEPNKTYYWRVRINDGEDYGPWSERYSFETDDFAGVPEYATGALKIESISPNPSYDSYPVITITSASSEMSEFIMYDIMGNIVYHEHFMLEEGTQSFSFRVPGSIVSGAYKVVVKSGNSMDSHDLMIVK